MHRQQLLGLTLVCIAPFLLLTHGVRDMCTWQCCLSYGHPSQILWFAEVYACCFPFDHVTGSGKAAWGASGPDADATEWSRLPPTWPQKALCNTFWCQLVIATVPDWVVPRPCAAPSTMHFRCNLLGSCALQHGAHGEYLVKHMSKF